MGREHGPLVHGDNALHVDVVELVDLKNFTAVFHDDVQTVGGLRFVRVRNHAYGKSGNVARMLGGQGKGHMQLRRAAHVQVVVSSTAHQRSLLLHTAHEHTVCIVNTTEHSTAHGWTKTCARFGREP